jgi:hypothetical protein
LCGSCSQKRRLENPKNNPNYKTGNSVKKYYECKDCGKKLSNNPVIRCKSCANKDKNNLNYINGKTHNNKCLDCGKHISFNSTRCKKCNDITRIGKIMTSEQKIRIGIANTGKIPTIETRTKISESNKGNKCYAWKGGITPLRKMLRKCMQYKMWFTEIFNRDKYICQKCSSKGIINAHHIIPFYKILDNFLNINYCLDPIKDKNKLFALALRYTPFWEISNGITLCKKCHKEMKKDI